MVYTNACGNCNCVRRSNGSRIELKHIHFAVWFVLILVCECSWSVPQWSRTSLAEKSHTIDARHSRKIPCLSNTQRTDTPPQTEYGDWSLSARQTLGWCCCWIRWRPWPLRIPLWMPPTRNWATNLWKYWRTASRNRYAGKGFGVIIIADSSPLVALALCDCLDRFSRRRQLLQNLQ